MTDIGWRMLRAEKPTGVWGGPVWFADVPTMMDAARLLSMEAQPQVLLLLVDSTAIESSEVVRFAGAAIDAGAVVVSVWGPGCERAHDIFDEVEAARKAARSDTRHIVTTWHEGETLSEAVAMFLATAALLVGRDPESVRWCVVVVGSVTTREDVERVIAEIDP